MKAGSKVGLGIMVGVIAVHAVQAAPVTLVGGFMSYSGPAWTHTYTEPVPTQISTSFSQNGGPTIVLTPSQSLPGDPDGSFANAGIGLGTIDFTNGGLAPPASQIDFWVDYGGYPDTYNRVAFTPAASQAVQSGEEFRIGTFTFANGGWFGVLPYSGGIYSYPESEFHFTVTTSSADATLNGHTFEGTVRLYISGHTVTATPADDADYFYFLERPDLGYVGAYETYNLPLGGSNVGSIDLYGKIGSLVPTRFANAQGVVLGEQLPGNSVPEPQTWALLMAGLGIVGAMRKRRDKPWQIVYGPHRRRWRS